VFLRSLDATDASVPVPGIAESVAAGSVIGGVVRPGVQCGMGLTRLARLNG
jgi:hypothetical protein